MKRCLPAAFVLAFLSAPLMAQNFQAGITPYGAYDEQGFDNIGLSNGNLILTIPLMSYPQKGTLPSVGYSLIANDPDWVQNCNTDDQGNTYCDWELDNNARFGPKPVPDNELWKAPCGGCDPLGVWTNVIDSTGAAYTAGPLNSNWTPYFTMDGSGYLLNSSGITDRNGVRHGGNPGPQSTTYWTDPSGNSVAVLSSNDGGYAGQGGYTDSFGRSIPAPPATCAPVGICGTGVSSPGCYENGYPAINGGTALFTFCFENITYSSDIGTADDPANQCSITEPGTAQALVLQSVTLPNGASWQFGYDSTGDIQSITTPTGGTVTYVWESQPGGTQCGYDGEVFNRWIQNRIVNAVPGNPAYAKTWTYSYTPSFSPVTVTDPDGNYTVWNFTNGPQGEIQYYDSSSNLLKTVTTTYFTFYNSYSYSYAVDTTLPELVTTTWPNRSVSASCTIWDQNTNTSCTPGSDGLSSSAGIFYYPYTYIHVPIIFGSQLYQYEYDYGTSSYGGALRKGVNSFQWQNSASYQSANLLNLLKSVQILDAGGTQRAYTYYNYDESFSYTGCNPGPCGNQTSVHQWLNSGATATASCNISVGSGGYLVIYRVYDSIGRVVSSVDSCGNGPNDSNHETGYGYSASSCASGQGWAGTGPTSNTNPLGQINSWCYDLNTGLEMSSTDANGQTTYDAYDTSRRLTAVNYPDTGQVTYTYSDGTPNPYFVFTQKITSGMNFTEQGDMDGLGRLIRTITTVPASTCSGGYVYADTVYDDLGRLGSVSNPYCTTSDPTYGIVQYQYDPLNRTTKVIDQDGSATTTTYPSFPCVTTTDEAGKSREGCTNGLAQLTDVYEDPNGLNQHTTYTYDPFNDLTGVMQAGSHQRSFAYDGLARLTSATNPESGTTSYGYDANGNVTTKTDARNITTTLSYDALNRLTQKSYSDGTPTANFQYDATSDWGATLTNTVGRLTESWTSGTPFSASVYSYDAMGRTTLHSQCTPYTCGWGGWATSYTYDLLGDTTSSTNGQGTTISQSFDTAGHLSTITSSLVDTNHPGTLATVNRTWPTGASQSMTLGNNLTVATLYNPRTQPCRINTNSSGSYFTALSQCSGSQPTGTIQDLELNLNGGIADNGDVIGWGASGQRNFNRTYSYDSLNRLWTMSAPGDTCSGISWTYDAWGNRNIQSATGGTCNTFSQTADGNSHLGTPYQYDAAGNMTYDGVHNYTYDAENRLTKVDGGTTASYSYDAGGNRTEKTAGGASLEYIYDATGHVVAEDSGTSWDVGFVYDGDQVVAQYDSDTTRFMHEDHLGSVRLVTDPNGNVLDSLDFLPFGEQIAGSQPWPHKFTGYERDAESNLDNANAREDSPAMGRFMSPDPENTGADPTNPQSWNMYSYVRNNPLSLADPTGLAYQLCLFGDVTGGYSQCGDVDTYSDLEAEVEEVGYSLAGSPDEGIIRKGDTVVGSYEYFTSDEDVLKAAAQGTQLAQPGVNIAYAGLQLFGGIVAAPAMVAAQCLSDRNSCSKTNIAFALIPIFIPEARLTKILEAHTVGGVLSAGKSLFYDENEVKSLIQAAESTTPSPQAYKNLERIVDAGRPIGTDRLTGQPTSIYTVITDKAGNVVTAFPGKP